MPQAIYPDQQTRAYDALAATLTENTARSGGTFDSVEAGKVLSELKHGRDSAKIPSEFAAVLDSVETGDAKRDDASYHDMAKAVLDGISLYEQEHGEAPSGDVLRWAMHQASTTTPNAIREMREKGHIVGTFDSASASSEHHDVNSMQVNRAVIAVTTAMAEALPGFAMYLPADIGSNEAPLIIVSHRAGSDWGGYGKGDILDGVSGGKPYISSARIVRMANTSGTWSGKFTAKINPADDELCVADAPEVKLLRGRSQVFVDGLYAGGETNSTGSNASSPMSGEVVISGTSHVMSGAIQPATGIVTGITFTPALPADTKVHVEAFIDYESQPELTPEFNTDSQKFTLKANAWRFKARQTIDSRTQFANEVGLDISAEAMMSGRTQYAQERHFQVIQRLNMLAGHNVESFNFAQSSQEQFKVRAQIWADFAPVVGVVDQRMANLTMDHGSSHMYVGERIAAQVVGLPPEIFTPSGISPRPGIYRIGNWMGKDVYYNPRAKETASSSRILLIGRSNQVARNPIILGDAVAPTQIPLSTNDDLSKGMAYYGRSFTQVNPHRESAMGVAAIDVTGLPTT